MIRRLSARIARRVLYPWSDGTARLKDPTYGQIDRDIQWFVHDVLRPTSLGVRAAAEHNLQRRRVTT